VGSSEQIADSKPTQVSQNLQFTATMMTCGSFIITEDQNMKY